MVAMAVIGKCQSVYLVRAESGTLYCGISDDPSRCLGTHRSGKGVRFLYSNPTRALAYVGTCTSKGDALCREQAIEALSKRTKKHLLAGVPVLREVNEPAIQDVHLRSWGIRGLPRESLVETLDPLLRL